MAKVTKVYRTVRFPVEVLEEALATLIEVEPAEQDAAPGPSFQFMTIRTADETWHYEHKNRHEFLADIRNPHDFAHVEARYYGSGRGVDFWESLEGSTVTVEAGDRNEIARILAPFTRDAAKYTVTAEPVAPRVFIGHGRSNVWREVSDFLHHQMGYEVEAFETLPRAGHDIVGVLRNMLDSTNFALLVMTAEDEQADGSLRARQNVVHEVGLWQGRIGWDRSIVLLEEGVEDFSNLAGVQQLRFPPGQIRAVHGDVLATLRREFPGLPG
jgi:hypothetical protein